MTEHAHTGERVERPVAFGRQPTPKRRRGSLSALPEPLLIGAPDGRTRFGRDDLVLRKGQYALAMGHFTPRESMIEDLIAVRDALIAAGIEFLLVRGDGDRAVIAVDRRSRREVCAALATAFANEPFYSQTVDHDDLRDVLVADGTLSAKRKASVFRLYRPRVEPIGRLRYGAETAFQLEFWRFGDEEIVAPRPNSLMRERMPRSEAVEDSVELYGRRWRTLENMFATHASDIDFDIDMVFSWVDGIERRLRSASAPSACRPTSSATATTPRRATARSTSCKYALRSVYMFAPWVRRIFIATDSPAPDVARRAPAGHDRAQRGLLRRPERAARRTTRMPSRASCTTSRGSPSTSSTRTTTCSSVAGLSPSCSSRPAASRSSSKRPPASASATTTRRAADSRTPPASTARLLHDRFGEVTTRHLEHCAAPLRKSVMRSMETEEFPEDFARTAASRVPLGHRHLGDELAVPLLRAA